MFSLILSENKEVFSPSADFLTGDGEMFDFDPLHQVIGHVSGIDDSHVHGFIAGGRFRGVIDVDGESYHVEPANAFFSEPQSFHSVMYREKDVNHSMALNGQPIERQEYLIKQQMKDNVLGDVRHARSRRATANLQNVECQIAVVADHHFAALIAREEGMICPSCHSFSHTCRSD